MVTEIATFFAMTNEHMIILHNSTCDKAWCHWSISAHPGRDLFGGGLSRRNRHIVVKPGCFHLRIAPRRGATVGKYLLGKEGGFSCGCTTPPENPSNCPALGFDDPMVQLKFSSFPWCNQLVCSNGFEFPSFSRFLTFLGTWGRLARAAMGGGGWSSLGSRSSESHPTGSGSTLGIRIGQGWPTAASKGNTVTVGWSGKTIRLHRDVGRS